MLWISAALGTAACFAVSSLIAYDAARAIGALTFSFIRMSMVAVGFGAWVLVNGADAMTATDIGLLSLSGFIGVLLSDTLRYASLANIGPQLLSLLNTAAAPFALVFGYLLLGQAVEGVPLLGTLFVMAGIMLTVALRDLSRAGVYDGNPAAQTSGLVLGLSAAATQAASILIAAPVMLKGVDPVSATMVRSAAGAASLLVPVLASRKRRTSLAGLGAQIWRQVLLSGAIGTGMGMTLQLYALSSGPAGIVATLSATTPLMVLVLVWTIGKSRPAASAWIGASLGVIGVAMILTKA